MTPKDITQAPSKEVTPPKEAERSSSSRRKWYVALLIVGLAGLAGAAALAVTGTLDDAERRFFNLVNHAYLPGWVTEQIAKPLGNAVLGIALLVIVLLAVPKYRLLAWQYVVAGGLAYAAALLVAQLVDRVQPAGLEAYDAIVRASQSGAGFPSVYVAILTALGLTVWPFVRWHWRIFILALIGAEAWSRIFLGVHAPLDVVGGAAVAASVVAVLHLLPSKFRNIIKLSA